LIKLESPLATCKQSVSDAKCTGVLKSLENPYYISDEPAYTQASGWVDAWTSAPSVYAVAAESTQDVVAAVNFAREKNLRLVVKGGGHSYLWNIELARFASHLDPPDEQDHDARFVHSERMQDRAAGR
jgi:hypothetical protein